MKIKGQMKFVFKKVRRSLLLLALLQPLAVKANQKSNSSCLPLANSLSTQFQLNQGTSSPDLRLFALEAEGPVPIRLVARVDHSIAKGTKLHLAFESDGQTFSLPYSLFAALVITPSGRPIWKDLTDACKGPGRSLFPGQSLEVKLQDPNNFEEGLYRIVLWGGL